MSPAYPASDREATWWPFTTVVFASLGSWFAPEKPVVYVLAFLAGYSMCYGLQSWEINKKKKSLERPNDKQTSN